MYRNHDVRLFGTNPNPPFSRVNLLSKASQSRLTLQTRTCPPPSAAGEVGSPCLSRCRRAAVRQCSSSTRSVQSAAPRTSRQCVAERGAPHLYRIANTARVDKPIEVSVGSLLTVPLKVWEVFWCRSALTRLRTGSSDHRSSSYVIIFGFFRSGSSIFKLLPRERLIENLTETAFFCCFTELQRSVWVTSCISVKHHC